MQPLTPNADTYRPAVPKLPVWPRLVLQAAGIYNLAWGTFIILFPDLPFQWAGMPPPNYPALWQCIGMIVGVYGIGYWIAAYDPVRHWPIVLVGLLGKIFGSVGFLFHAFNGTLPWIAGITCLTNDLPWWPPFFAILFLALRERDRAGAAATVGTLAAELGRAVGSHGRNLLELSYAGPVLLLFVRHAGCTFCREALATLKRDEPHLRQQGVQLAVVHMGDDVSGRKLAATYHLEAAHWISDPERRLYQACELPLGTFGGLFGLKPLWRGTFGGALLRHGIGALQGSGWQLGGAFFLRHGKLERAERYETSADQTDFVEFCRTAGPGDSSGPPPADSAGQNKLVQSLFHRTAAPGTRDIAPMLELRQVKKSYPEPGGGSLPILDIPHFAVDTGEQMVLVGRSGCGKTTLLHCIAGISRADSGWILLGGVDLNMLSEAGRDRIRAQRLGYVFQTFNLLPGFTALENVILGMTFGRGKHDADRAKHLLSRVGLSHRATHKPAALSVGEQQRVAVARALANKPNLLLADEPTANVDPRNQQQIIDLIRETCREEKIALVMVTHSTEVAAQFQRVDKLEDINQLAVQAAPK